MPGTSLRCDTAMRTHSGRCCASRGETSVDIFDVTHCYFSWSVAGTFVVVEQAFSIKLTVHQVAHTVTGVLLLAKTHPEGAG